MKKKKVLFLCTGNSCRSHMAEGLTNHFLGDVWIASSAGTEPAGYVHPMAITAVTELNVNISHHHSKTIETFRNSKFDVVITVCDDASENCPIWLGKGKVVHISFPDPAKATGTDEEILAVFRNVRDSIKDKLLEYLVLN